MDKITSMDRLQENVHEDIAHALILDHSIQEQMKSNMLHSKQNESNRQQYKSNSKQPVQRSVPSPTEEYR